MINPDDAGKWKVNMDKLSKDYKLTENEINEHKKTIKKIKGPMWKLYN